VRENGFPEDPMMAFQQSPLHPFPRRRGSSPLIHRYFESREARTAVKVAAGGVYATGQDEDLVTVLGSCVSACIHDPVSRVGGINHFMLPEDGGDGPVVELLSDAHRYGCFAMEHLINEVLKLGAGRERLCVKLFGGAHLLSAGSRVGEMNIAFARQYVRKEGLKLLAEDLGGSAARRLKYVPRTGQAFLWRPGKVQMSQVEASEVAYRESLQAEKFSGEVEMF
jgi:chemotaxis protein CheD